MLMGLNKKVLLFGGSYNPIHQGHINAALVAYNAINADEVWLIPRKYNYDGSLLLDGKIRINMIKMAIKDLPQFKICKIELNDTNKELIYTYNTAKILVNKYPNIDFYFLIGADQLNNLIHWYNAKELTTMFKFVCYLRPGHPLNYEIAKEYNVQVLDGNQIDVSSTLIRSGAFSNLDDNIKKYICKKQLYLKERVMPRLPEERFIHSLSTARLAKQIAKSIDTNANKAYVAGILHDIAKGLSFDQIENIVKENYKSKINYPKYCYHAYASAFIAKRDFGINDKEILKAIKNHCRPTKTMSKLDKIIYCADKLELSRPFADRLNVIRNLAFIDINKCFIATMEDQLNFLKESNSKVDPNLVKMISFYKGENS